MVEEREREVELKNNLPTNTKQKKTAKTFFLSKLNNSRSSSSTKKELLVNGLRCEGPCVELFFYHEKQGKIKACGKKVKEQEKGNEGATTTRITRTTKPLCMTEIKFILLSPMFSTSSTS